jgi:outer membrane protein
MDGLWMIHKSYAHKILPSLSGSKSAKPLMLRILSPLLLGLFLLCLSGNTYAQKFGYIDAKFVLEKLPEYKAAQSEITKQTQTWQKEIEALNGEVDRLRKEYLAEEVLLTDEMKGERQEIINKRDKAAKEQQKKIFGFEGLYFLKKQELIKPVQDKVFDAVEKVCKKKKVQIMFDKSADLVMIYTDPKHDYTDFVLEELGLGDPKDTVDNKKKKGGDGAAPKTDAGGSTPPASGAK